MDTGAQILDVGSRESGRSPFTPLRNQEKELKYRCWSGGLSRIPSMLSMIGVQYIREGSCIGRRLNESHTSLQSSYRTTPWLVAVGRQSIPCGLTRGAARSIIVSSRGRWEASRQAPASAERSAGNRSTGAGSWSKVYKKVRQTKKNRRSGLSHRLDGLQKVLCRARRKIRRIVRGGVACCRFKDTDSRSSQRRKSRRCRHHQHPHKGIPASEILRAKRVRFS